MENDPWKSVFDEIDNPTPIEGFQDDIEHLTVLNAIRKHSGDPYEVGPIKTMETVSLQGEAEADDIVFKEAIRSAVTDALDHPPTILYNP